MLRQIAQFTGGRYIFLTYGESGESDGGTPATVSHHTGSNWQSRDLDAIVMKAIARDREARYPSVAAFHDDLLNFLNRKPVNAQPQDFTYVANLFVQRNLGLVAAGALLLLLVLAAPAGPDKPPP
mgnify:CR=1 FL=1